HGTFTRPLHDALPISGGTATIIGMIPVGQKVELEGSVFLREKKIQGCNMGSNRFKVDMPKYIDFYRQGRLKLDEMITRTVTLDRSEEHTSELQSRVEL